MKYLPSLAACFEFPAAAIRPPGRPHAPATYYIRPQLHATKPHTFYQSGIIIQASICRRRAYPFRAGIHHLCVVIFQVILDNDLAAIYGVETKRLNEQVRRNTDRFPSESNAKTND